MTRNDIRRAMLAAKEFISRCDIVLKAHERECSSRGVKMEPDSDFDITYYVSPRETGSLRRQSMELTRALADMRGRNR